MPNNRTIDSERDNVYFEASLSNVGSQQNIPAVYKSRRSSPIVVNPFDYYLTVDNFSVSGQAIPILKNYPTVLDRRFRVVLIDENGVKHFSTVQNIPVYDDSRANNFYYVDQFLDAVNVAFTNAYISAYGDADPDHPLDERPFFDYDGNTEVASLVVSQGFLGTLAVNNLLAKKFSNFFLIANGNGFNLDGDDFRFAFPTRVNQADSYRQIITYPCWVQQANTKGYTSLFDVKALIVVTDMLPIYSSFVTEKENNSQATRKQLLKIILSKESVEQKYREITYDDDLAKYIDLTTNAPLFEIDYTVFIEYVDGTKEVLTIPPGGYMDLALIFVKKDEVEKETIVRPIR